MFTLNMRPGQMGEGHSSSAHLALWKRNLSQGRGGGGVKAPRIISTIKVSLSHDCFLLKRETALYLCRICCSDAGISRMTASISSN